MVRVRWGCKHLFDLECSYMKIRGGFGYLFQPSARFKVIVIMWVSELIWKLGFVLLELCIYLQQPNLRLNLLLSCAHSRWWQRAAWFLPDPNLWFPGVKQCVNLFVRLSFLSSTHNILEGNCPCSHSLTFCYTRIKYVCTSCCDDMILGHHERKEAVSRDFLHTSKKPRM